MKQNTTYKTFFLNYLIFILIAAVIFLLLIYSVKVSQNSWDNNLKQTIETFFDEQEPDNWIVETPVRIKSPLITSLACYDTRNKKNGEYYKTFIVRIQTLYGPVPGIFIMDKNNNVDFKGFAVIHGRVAELLHKNTFSKRIDYWRMRIPEMVK